MSDWIVLGRLFSFSDFWRSDKANESSLAAKIVFVRGATQVWTEPFAEFNFPRYRLFKGYIE